MLKRNRKSAEKNVSALPESRHACAETERATSRRACAETERVETERAESRGAHGGIGSRWRREMLRVRARGAAWARAAGAASGAPVKAPPHLVRTQRGR